MDNILIDIDINIYISLFKCFYLLPTVGSLKTGPA